LLGGEIWRVGVVYLVVLSFVLRAMIKKGREIFLAKKVHPLPWKKPGYACGAKGGVDVGILQ